MTLNFVKKNIFTEFCQRELNGLHCRCRYRKLPNTCPYLHKNETDEQYKGRMLNDSNYGFFETAEQQWERWSKFGEPSIENEEYVDEPDGEFYAYTYL